MTKTKAEMTAELNRLSAKIDEIKGIDENSDDFFEQLRDIVEKKMIIFAKIEVLLWAMNIKY